MHCLPKAEVLQIWHHQKQGIGLYVVRGQLRMMQSGIIVESKVNQASCFHLYFSGPPTE